MNGKSIIILIESNMFLKAELNQFQNHEIIHIFLLCSTTTADYWTSGEIECYNILFYNIYRLNMNSTQNDENSFQVQHFEQQIWQTL